MIFISARPTVASRAEATVRHLLADALIPETNAAGSRRAEAESMCEDEPCLQKIYGRPTATGNRVDAEKPVDDLKRFGEPKRPEVASRAIEFFAASAQDRQCSWPFYGAQEGGDLSR